MIAKETVRITSEWKSVVIDLNGTGSDSSSGEENNIWLASAIYGY